MLSIEALAGIIVGCFIAVVIALNLVCYFRKKRNLEKQKQEE